MKNLTYIIAVLSMFAFSTNIVAQSKSVVKEEITLTEENGVKTLKITTTENGKSKTEVFNNADADKKLAELEKTGSVSKTVIVAPDGSAYTKIEVKKKK